MRNKVMCKKCFIHSVAFVLENFSRKFNTNLVIANIIKVELFLLCCSQM